MENFGWWSLEVTLFIVDCPLVIAIVYYGILRPSLTRSRHYMFRFVFSDGLQMASAWQTLSGIGWGPVCLIYRTRTRMTRSRTILYSDSEGSFSFVDDFDF